MNLNIELSDELGEALQALARAKGVSPARFVSRLLEHALTDEIRNTNAVRKPLSTGYGSWAKYGTAPSAEEIDENRREMFRKFGTDL